MITDDLDSMLNDLNQNKVPSIWSSISFVSDKSLGSWINDIKTRVLYF